MTTATAIPCKRPKVTVAETAKHSGSFVVSCLVPGCGFRYPASTSTGTAIKTDAEEQARRHRDGHRRAVPQVTVVQGARRSVDHCCACGWVTPPDQFTLADRKASLDYHLSREHGLVTC